MGSSRKKLEPLSCEEWQRHISAEYLALSARGNPPELPPPEPEQINHHEPSDTPKVDPAKSSSKPVKVRCGWKKCNKNFVKTSETHTYCCSTHKGEAKRHRKYRRENGYDPLPPTPEPEPPAPPMMTIWINPKYLNELKEKDG